MSYSDSQLFMVELFATALSLVFGLGATANALLPGTKGHGFGIMGIALGFGFGVFVALQAMGHISGLLNPAITFGVAVAGRISWKRAWISICAQNIGAFIAALVTWILYLPHFQPLTGCITSENSDSGPIGDISQASQQQKRVHVFQELTSKARRYASARRDASSKEITRMESEGHCRSARHMRPKQHEWHLFQGCRSRAKKEPRTVEDLEMTSKPEEAQRLDYDATVSRKQRVKLDERIREDQEVKLVVFATRPSTLEPFHWTALFAETLCTFLLTFGALAILDREAVFGNDSMAKEAYKTGSAPYLIGVLVWVTILGAGGVTGPAINPARDLAPRIAHFLLPIPGKGSSEWHYSWVPVLGPVIGATLGALSANALKKVYETGL